MAIEEQEIAGAKLELFVINFIKDKMTLRVPTAKIASVGMRKLAEAPLVKRALETLKGRARIKRTMWSRRAQEYEAKINSGDIVAIAEVVRDLFRSETQPEQSYSERQLYEAALDRLSREIAAVQQRHRDRSDQGDRGGARQGPAPRSEARRGGGGGTPSRKRRPDGLSIEAPTNDEKPGSDAGLFDSRGDCQGHSYSITSSASASSVGGTSRPSALAVLRLMHELEFGGLHDRQVGRLLALENPPGVDAGLAIGIGNAGSVAHQAAGHDGLALG